MLESQIRDILGSLKTSFNHDKETQILVTVTVSAWWDFSGPWTIVLISSFLWPNWDDLCDFYDLVHMPWREAGERTWLDGEPPQLKSATFANYPHLPKVESDHALPVHLSLNCQEGPQTTYAFQRKSNLSSSESRFLSWWPFIPEAASLSVQYFWECSIGTACRPVKQFSRTDKQGPSKLLFHWQISYCGLPSYASLIAANLTRIVRPLPALKVMKHCMLLMSCRDPLSTWGLPLIQCPNEQWSNEKLPDHLGGCGWVAHWNKFIICECLHWLTSARSMSNGVECAPVFWLNRSTWHILSICLCQCRRTSFHPLWELHLVHSCLVALQHSAWLPLFMTMARILVVSRDITDSVDLPLKVAMTRATRSSGRNVGHLLIRLIPFV